MPKRVAANTGILSREELCKLPGCPSGDRLKKGPACVIECAEEIPCNPCGSACPQGAIYIGENILGLPALDEDICTGCGECIPSCPGLAIFIVDLTFSDKEALVKLPYEFLPIPKINEMVICRNREGEIICQGRTVEVLYNETYDKTIVVAVAVPKEYGQEVRAITVERSEASSF